MLLTNLINKTCVKCGKNYQVMESFSFGESICIECQYPEPIKNDVHNIVIKHADIQVNNENISLNSQPKPLSLNEFIGQESNKSAINTAIKIIKTIKPINIFIHGYSGCGKSTLAEIISSELKAEFIYTIPEQLKNMDKISEVLNKIQAHNGLTVWMIDECHNLDKKLINILLPILQDHKLGDTIIREFVLIMATTDYNKLHKKSEALISRFQSRIYLEKYTTEELVKILKQYKQKLNINVNIPDEDYILLASNSKGIPREAINMLLKRLVLPNVDDIFHENKIVRNGLNLKDIQILNILLESTSPIGANFLSQKAGLLDADFQQVYEPFLVSEGLIERTQKGRIISIKGKKLIEDLK